MRVGAFSMEKHQPSLFFLSFTLDGMKKYGFFYGFLLGCDRLMRENDAQWHYKKMYGEYGLTKYDPVR